MRKSVEILTQQLAHYKDVEVENSRLKKLLDFKETAASKLIAARVISKDSTNFSDTITIDKGKSSGIEKDAVVIAEAGLVGHIYSNSSGISIIMLITDPNSRVSAVVSRSRQSGMVYGVSSKLCVMRYLPLDADIRVGDDVMTSGLSDIYPNGLLIGSIVKIAMEQRGLTLYAIIKPSVDISNIEEVLCIE